MSAIKRSLSQAIDFLWKVAEIGFVATLVTILVYIFLGDTSGTFVTAVFNNAVTLVEALTYQGTATIVIAAFLYRYFIQKFSS